MSSFRKPQHLMQECSKPGRLFGQIDLAGFEAGALGLHAHELITLRSGPDLAYLYLVFDPGRGNRGGAEWIHGFSDSALRLQDPFAVHAAEVWRFLTSYELLVAHNAAFDLRFINREMRFSGLPALTRPVYCT